MLPFWRQQQQCLGGHICIYIYIYTHLGLDAIFVFAKAIKNPSLFINMNYCCWQDIVNRWWVFINVYLRSAMHSILFLLSAICSHTHTQRTCSINSDNNVETIAKGMEKEAFPCIRNAIAEYPCITVLVPINEWTIGFETEEVCANESGLKVHISHLYITCIRGASSWYRTRCAYVSFFHHRHHVIRQTQIRRNLERTRHFWKVSAFIGYWQIP